MSTFFLLTGLLLLTAGVYLLYRNERTSESALALASPPDGKPGEPHPLQILSLPIAKGVPIGGTTPGVLLGSGMALIVAGAVLVFAPRPAPPVPDRGQLVQLARERYGLVLVDPDQAPTTVKVVPPSAQPGPGASAASPVSSGRAPRVIFVAPGDLAPTVADKLVAVGVVSDRRVFLQRLVERALDTDLKPGEFSLAPGTTIDQIIDTLTS